MSLTLYHTNLLGHYFLLKASIIHSKIIETIDNNNLVFLNKDRLIKIAEKSIIIIDLLFSSWGNSIVLALDNCSKLILTIKASLDENKTSNLLSLEYVFRFNELFNELHKVKLRT